MNQSVSLPSVDSQPRVRRSTYIANHLRNMIFTGALKPGDRLPTEEQLCKHFGVSRTTLRESVQMLRVSGLLDVTPGRGSFIRLPNPSVLMKDLALLGQYGTMNTGDVDSLRVLLQVEMVRLACDASAEDKKILQGHIISRQGNAEEIEETERSWHLAIAKIAGNDLSATMLEALLSMQRTERLTNFEDADEIMRTMGVQIRLNSAIQEGDKNMATRVVASYLGGSAPQFKN
ncbi:MAG: GntR family transcriptional repressor for pyruvate dehydrogenase complex [Alphaproteobacteria bacterium]|jgi:GntR family transcriptional repressor for pyruvate dehydrogenase complex